MKQSGSLCIAILGVFAVVLSASPQKHPSVASGAPQTSAKHLHSMLGNGSKIMVIDVRAPEEYSKGHIPQAVNIPIDELDKKISTMNPSRDTTIVTVCDHGGRSSRAALMLRKLGYKTSSFCQLASWEKNGYKVAKGNQESGIK